MNEKTPTSSFFEDFYWKITHLWKNFCQDYLELLEKGFEEYEYLLSHNVEALEECLARKNQFLEKLICLEKKRQKMIQEFNDDLPGEENELKEINDLIKRVEVLEIEKKQKYFLKFNTLLLELIKKNQLQNKKNQLLINKILYSLKSIKEEALGRRDYTAYNEKGISASLMG